MTFLTFGINIQDVLNVLDMVKTELTILVAALVLALGVTVGLIFAKGLGKPVKKLVRGNAWLAMILVLVIVVNTMLSGPLYTMVNNALGNANKISEDSIEEAYAYNDEIAGEGMTLLENDGLLPLAEGTKLNVFGWSSTNPVYGGVGSGALNFQYDTTSLLQGLTDAGFEVNQELVDFYTAYCAERPSVGMWAQDWTLPEPNVNLYTDEMMASAKAYSDVALVVVSRPGGENADLPWDMTSVVDGSWMELDALTANSYFNGVYDDTLNEGNDWDEGDHYLQLTNREEELLDLVCSNFDNVVVVINTNNVIETGFLNEYDQIKGAVYCPCPGQNGFAALGKVLDGEINPSGKTVDTWLYDLMEGPYANNFGYFMYDNMDEHRVYSVSWFTGAETIESPMFLNYVEGIYVGYKFWETAADEGFLTYEDYVSYPFGYGLSYTTFTQEMSELTVTDTTISFDVTVTNTGSVAGKEVVEVYFDPPYINGGIEKATANLVAFDKTAELTPGASEVVHFDIAIEDMASYDEYVNEAYVLDAGDYTISVNANSHDILDAKVWTLDETIVYSDGRASDVAAATNQFEDAYGDKATYLSRADGFANYDVATAAPVDMSLSDEYKASFINNANYDVFSLNNDADVMPTLGANNGLSLEDLVGVDYDDPKWDELLDQLTVEDMVLLIKSGGYSTAAVESVGKVGTYDCDGPASINNNYTGEGSIGFCGSVMVSSSWNSDMSYNFGSSIGRMADELDVSGWYAPAMNIHRTAFSGRNFEYWSEDGVLSGYMAAAAIQGAEAHGVYSYIKHFAMNDQETGRNTMICTWSNEQAIREIYLKSFEIAVKVGGADAVMSSFNYIGTTWAGGYDALLNKVLRDEWGFNGMVLTDYYGGYGYMDADQAIRNGGDVCLAPYDIGTNILDDQQSATSLQAARTACKHILYTVANSRAYYEENLNPGAPAWQIAVYGVSAGILVLLVVWEVLMVKKYKKTKETA